MSKEQDDLRDIGKSAYECIAEMVAKLNTMELDDNGEETTNRDDDACEQAREKIQEDALSVEVRSDWTEVGEPLTADEYCVLLSAGGPATRIVGDLNQYGEPSSAQLEAQNWRTAWTEYLGADRDVLLAYVGCFSFGEGSR